MNWDMIRVVSSALSVGAEGRFFILRVVGGEVSCFRANGSLVETLPPPLLVQSTHRTLLQKGL